jgi:alpha-amylase
MSFVTNHDTDRNAGEYLGHKDGARFILANEWLLASGYGSPQVYSSFDWETRDDSPPATADGLITDADCTSPAWTCDHRNRGIVAMVGWHNYVGTAKRANWYTDDANVIAFSRAAGDGRRSTTARPRKRSGSRPVYAPERTATSSTTPVRVPAVPARPSR